MKYKNLKEIESIDKLIEMCKDDEIISTLTPKTSSIYKLPPKYYFIIPEVAYTELRLYR